MKPSPRVLVLEPHLDGHHGFYLRWMVAGLVNAGARVMVITQRQNLNHSAVIALTTAGSADAVAVTGVSDISAQSGGAGQVSHLVLRELAFWRTFRTWYEEAAATFNPTLVFVPYLDTCLYSMALFGAPFRQCPWVGVAMRPAFHYREMGILAPQRRLDVLKKALVRRLLRDGRLKQLLTVDEPLFEYVSRKADFRGRITYLPQPAEFGVLPNTDVARRELGLPLEKRYVLVYGRITLRKGVTHLLKALAVSEFPASVDVVLAGYVDEDVQPILREPWVERLIASGRVRLLDRHVSEHEEGLLFAACDIVWLGYVGHYTASGVLAQAAAAGRPVVACKEGVIGWETARHSLGEVVSPDRTFEVVAAVKALLNGPAIRYRSGHGAQQAPVSTIAQSQSVLARALMQDDA